MLREKAVETLVLQQNVLLQDLEVRFRFFQGRDLGLDEIVDAGNGLGLQPEQLRLGGGDVRGDHWGGMWWRHARGSLGRDGGIGLFVPCGVLLVVKGMYCHDGDVLP